jgi:hypothetical protein
MFPGVGANDLHRPPAVLARPAGGGDPVVVPDRPREVVLLDHLVEVGEDLPAGGDRGPSPRLEPVAVGEQVAVRAHTGIAVGPPGAAPVVLRLHDDEGLPREVVSQVIGGADTGDPGPDHQDIDVLDLAAAGLGDGRGLGHRHGAPPPL